MPLRIGFDMDGVFADMDGELIRQAEGLFGPGVARRPLSANPAIRPAADAPIAAAQAGTARPLGAPELSPDATADTGSAPNPDPAIDPAGEPAVDETPPVLRLQMTSRQQRRLWRHVEGIENFWET